MWGASSKEDHSYGISLLHPFGVKGTTGQYGGMGFLWPLKHYFTNQFECFAEHMIPVLRNILF